LVGSRVDLFECLPRLGKTEGASYFFQENILSGHHCFCCTAPPVMLPNHTGTDNYCLSGLVVNYRVLLGCCGLDSLQLFNISSPTAPVVAGVKICCWEEEKNLYMQARQCTLLEVLQRPQSHFSCQSRRKTQAPYRAVEAALVTVPIVAGRERTDARGIDIVGQRASDTAPPRNVRV